MLPIDNKFIEQLEPLMRLMSSKKGALNSMNQYATIHVLLITGNTNFKNTYISLRKKNHIWTT